MNCINPHRKVLDGLLTYFIYHPKVHNLLFKRIFSKIIFPKFRHIASGIVRRR